MFFCHRHHQRWEILLWTFHFICLSWNPHRESRMNAVRGFFSKLKTAVPKGAGGAPGGGVPPAAGAGLSVLFALGLGSYGAYHSMVTIQPGHKGVVYNRFGGLDDRHYLREGLNFVVPWFQRPIVFDCRTRPQPIDTTSGSKGTVVLQLSRNWAC